MKTAQWHTTVWSPERLKLKRLAEPNIDECGNQPQSSTAGENAKKKKIIPNWEQGRVIYYNSDLHLLYDLRISFLEFAQGNIKPLPGQTCACMCRSSSTNTYQSRPAMLCIHTMEHHSWIKWMNHRLMGQPEELSPVLHIHMCFILMKPARLNSYILYDTMYMEFYKRQISRGGQWLPGARESNAEKHDVYSSSGDNFCFS